MTELILSLGEILLYAGPISEPEMLIPYGPGAFACRAGALAGNHVGRCRANTINYGALAKPCCGEARDDSS
jgi:hypothetical protein